MNKQTELRIELNKLCDVASAFLAYFNPAIDLSSAKESQWWILSDEIQRAKRLLENG